jgi:hypothetical protein
MNDLSAKRSWQERMEEKVDSIATDVAALKEQMRWRTKLLIAIGGLLGAIATALLGGCQPPSPQYPPDAADLHAYGAPVRVVCIYPQAAGLEPRSYAGTAVPVSPSLAVTARHVVDCDLETNNGLVDGEPFEIRIGSVEFVVEYQGNTPADDFAILQAVGMEQPFQRWTTPADRGPGVGDKVCVAPVYPEYEPKKCGTVIWYRLGTDWPGEGMFDFVGEAPGVVLARPGNSGSGVFNEDGELVGLLVGGSVFGSAIGYSAYRWYERVPAYYPPPPDDVP